jgi:dUTPase
MSSLFILLGGKRLRKSTQRSAGLDIYLHQDSVVLPGQVNYLPLGFMLNPETQHEDVCYLLLPRSSSYKNRDYEIKLGLIDNDYPDEIKLIVVGNEEKEVVIPANTKIAQFLPIKYLPVEADENVIFSQEERVGGFGSTD